MQISGLINDLQRIMDKHGDCEVLIGATNYSFGGHTYAISDYMMAAKVDEPERVCATVRVSKYGAAMTERKPKVGDDVYFNGLFFGYGGKVTAIADDNRLSFRTTAGYCGFGYMYELRGETWYLDWKSSSIGCKRCSATGLMWNKRDGSITCYKCNGTGKGTSTL